MKMTFFVISPGYDWVLVKAKVNKKQTNDMKNLCQYLIREMLLASPFFLNIYIFYIHIVFVSHLGVSHVSLNTVFFSKIHKM